ncbi:MAG TPA: hypothetical protein ENN97_10515 [Phycisphaerales bacterium]|nr:hypothetical protein [Phycisphaerales bacterium]
MAVFAEARFAVRFCFVEADFFFETAFFFVDLLAFFLTAFLPAGVGFEVFSAVNFEAFVFLEALETVAFFLVTFFATGIYPSITGFGIQLCRSK